MEPDFSGYATKAGLKCSDGRTITPEAFKHMDGKQVPLVWQHDHTDPEKILGHVILRHVADGMRSDAFFNETAAGKAAKALVLHGDVKFLSIYANQLVEKSKQVLHGMIREVSLVLAGANPGAVIDNVRVAHSADDIEVLDDEAIIHTGLEIELPGKTGEDGKPDDSATHADGPTLQDVYDSLNDDQKELVHVMVAEAMSAQQESDAAEHSDGEKPEGDLEHKEGTTEVKRNVFDQSAAGGTDTKPVIAHADVVAIFENGKKLGSFKEAINAYFQEHSDLLQHGVDNIDLLFPDAKMVMDAPEWDKRRTEWVSTVINGTHKTPFSRIKTMVANLTLAAARAKGYVKGALKKEEFFGITKRTTGPTTVYKKQSLDRDDIIDITDFDIVAWLWGEIRLMLEEEVARAILLGDGRDVDDEDKIADPNGASSGNGIRSILNDHDYYAQTLYVNLGGTPDYLLFIDEVIASRRFYKGTGLPTMFTTEVHIAKMLTLRSGLTGMRMYRNLDELASELRVSAIVAVEPMEEYEDVIAILVNLTDYNVGTDKGGEISRFDDFDIDYNKFKYLMETRLSGALTKVKSALIYRSVASTDVLVVPNEPTFVSSTGVVTIVATTGVVYKNKDTGATLSTGAQSALASGASITVVATPASGYYLADNINDEWTFTRD
jgi:hypothetical protein